MPTATEAAVTETKTTHRVAVGILAVVALAIALSLGSLIILLVVRGGLSQDPKLGVVLSLIGSFVVFFGVIAVLAASFVRRPRAELMRKEGWRVLSGTLAFLGVASALAFHWTASLPWLAMALFCLLKEFKEPSYEAIAPGGGGPGYLKIGTLRGTAMFVHWSLPFGGFAISAFVGFDVREAVYYSIGLLCVIGLHETAHVLAARIVGLKVFSVQISGFGGLCRIDLPRRTSHAFLLYSAGLLAQAALLAGAMLYRGLAGVPSNPLGRTLLASFTVVNLVWIVFSLIPFRGRSGIASDGLVLWQLLRHVVWKHPSPIPRLDFLPGDKAPVFPPETSLLSIPELVPDGFDHGVEMLNDRTTPMLFVVAMLMHHLGRTQEDAIRLMAAIHNKGGALIRVPTRERAAEVARAVTADSAAAGHRLVCRAVDARAASGDRKESVPRIQKSARNDTQAPSPTSKDVIHPVDGASPRAGRQSRRLREMSRWTGFPEWWT